MFLEQASQSNDQDLYVNKKWIPVWLGTWLGLSTAHVKWHPVWLMNWEQATSGHCPMSGHDLASRTCLPGSLGWTCCAVQSAQLYKVDLDNQPDVYPGGWGLFFVVLNQSG